MSTRLRFVLPVSISSCLALGGVGVVLAGQGDAAPLPTEYSATTTADLWHVNRLDLDMSGDPADTDLGVFRVTGLMNATTSPRSHAEADNLAGATATGQGARRAAISEATRSTDTSGPTAGIAPSGSIAGTLDVSQATLGARGRWVGDQGCIQTADGLVDSTAVGGGASLAPTNIPSGNVLPPVVLPSDLPTVLPTSSPTELPTTLPTILPTTTDLPTSTDSATIIPTEPPTITLPPLPTLTLGVQEEDGTRGAAPAASASVVMAAVRAGTVQQRVDLPLLNDATGDDRGVRAQAIGTVKDSSTPAMTFFGGEVEMLVTREARLTAYADGVHPSAVVWSPPSVAVRLAGQSTTYPLPTDGSPLQVSYSQNSDVTLTLAAGALTQEVTSTGLLARGKTSVAHMVVRNGDSVALDADFMPMSVEAKAPGGGVECPAPDTDGDGLSDDLEAQIHTNAGLKDTDRDKLSDGQEYLKYKTNPLKPDTDKDRLTDGQEVKKFHTLPRKPDTDRDKLKDGDEVKKYRTNPRKKDTDGDGVADNVEIKRGTDPRHK